MTTQITTFNLLKAKKFDERFDGYSEKQLKDLCKLLNFCSKTQYTHTLKHIHLRWDVIAIIEVYNSKGDFLGYTTKNYIDKVIESY